jgi:23S rRNA (guanine745-N1)-methyltransferase
VILACTVRDCGLALVRTDRAWRCARGHTYDVARSGYVNLLQPQDRKSADAGDRKTSVDARARLFALGIGRALVDEIVRRAAAVRVADRTPAIVDLGSGTGDVLGKLAHTHGIDGIGIDLSTAAAAYAARRFPGLTWVVANADRRLPLLDRCLDLVLSVNGRRNPAECARVLKPGGLLLVAIPAPDDLAELRELVQGARVERDRADALLAEHAPCFTLRERASIRERRLLDGDALRDLLRGTYRGERQRSADRVGALADLEVTLASDLFLFSAVRSA